MVKTRVLILLLLGLIIIAPDFTYNIWPQEVPYGWTGKQFMTGNFDLKGRVLPPVYYEVRSWLDTQVQPGGIFRLFWLPIDPAVVSNLDFLYPDAPVYFPRFDDKNYTQLIFAYLSNSPNPILGWGNGLGKLLATANVKYIIVNLSANEGGGIWKQDGAPALSPWGPGWDLTYYFTGDPKGYSTLLDREQDLKLVSRHEHFLIYENLDFVPYVSAYRSAFLVAPKAMLDKRPPSFSVLNYTNNLVANGGFENGTTSWSLAGDWKTSPIFHSGNNSLEATRKEQGWITASQDILFQGNRSYYFSGWTKLENVRQSHVRLTFYDSDGNILRGTYPLSGTDGTKDWWFFSEAGISPHGTARISLELLGGWSLDGVNTALTWFDDVSFVEGYYPVPSPSQIWTYDVLVASSMQGLISDIPGFDGRRNLVVSGDQFSTSGPSDARIKQFATNSTGLLFLGNAVPFQSGTEWASQISKLLFVYEAESVLQPDRGVWQHLQAPYLSNNQAAELLGDGQSTQSFYVPRGSNYTIAVRAESRGVPSMSIDGINLHISSVSPFSVASGEFNWYEGLGQFLGIGSHKLTISASGNQTVLDKIVMISSISGHGRLEDFTQGSAANVEMTKISTTQYNVKISSESPTYVVFGETYHPDWNAYFNGLKLPHLPLPLQMYWSNVFYLAKNGQSLVEISFDRQGMRNTLVALWAMGWASSLGYIGIASRSRIARTIRNFRKLSWPKS
jgi:hypothetical protein